MHMMFATNDSLSPQTCQHIAASIQVNSQISAMCITRDLKLPRTFQYIFTSIRVKGYIHVMYVSGNLILLVTLRHAREHTQGEPIYI